MTDAVSPKTRTVTYVVSLVWGATATGASAVVAVLTANHYLGAALAAVIVGVLGAVSGVVVTICGGLGTAYRPTTAALDVATVEDGATTDAATTPEA